MSSRNRIPRSEEHGGCAERDSRDAECDRLLALARPTTRALSPVDADRMFRAALARSGASRRGLRAWLLPVWGLASAAAAVAGIWLTAGAGTQQRPSAQLPVVLPVVPDRAAKQVARVPDLQVTVARTSRGGRHAGRRVARTWHRHLLYPHRTARPAFPPNPSNEDAPVLLAGIPFRRIECVTRTGVPAASSGAPAADERAAPPQPARPSRRGWESARSVLFVAVTDLPQPPAPVTVRAMTDDTPGFARVSATTAAPDGRWLVRQVCISSETPTPELVLRSFPAPRP